MGQAGGAGFIGTAAPTTATTGTRGGATAVGIPSTSNLWAPYYTDPRSLGLKAGAKGTFGQAMYAITSTPATKATPKQGSNAANKAAGFNTFGQPRDVPYAVVPGDDLPRPVAESPKLAADLQGHVQRSSLLPSKENIAVTIENDVVVLRGQVGSQREKGLVERMLRLTPGVRELRNELTVGP
jgi:hypothetical protein